MTVLHARPNRGTATGVVAVVAGVVVVLMPPDRADWSATLAAVTRGGPAPDLDAVATLVAGTGLWVLALWVGLALAAGYAARLPGAAGAAGRLAVRVCVPRVFRAVVTGGVAGGLLLGPAVAASAAPVWPTAPTAPTSVSEPTTPGPAWPTSPPPSNAPTATTPPPTTPAPATPAPTTPAPTTPAPTTPAPASGPTEVVVRPGDSLWSIAAADLTRHGVAPTAARVAAAWPTWYAANRAVVGGDPDLLRPGTHLTVPTMTDGGSS